ncbi:MAG: hypothetical protein M1821_006969 [Bathelium mastoideum]|nr:MAG: hypothetical protein M1821_006969 [Bathelium mastoideum]
MAHRERAPYRPQDVHEVAEMVRGLESHQKKSGKGGFSTKKATFDLPNGQEVDSWRIQDWDYKKPHLPTYARGLFTTRSRNGTPEIVARGYDKFFNHGEVRKTEWRNVEQNTQGPYELSVKENGCIIFISGLEDGSLLVCSKHSTGSRGDQDVSHAQAGEKWVDKHLESVGKTRKQLSRALRDMNATAVAELCDDDFEEHVLAYNPETAGLYLHGINLNLPEFVTYPGHLVDRFATEWGMKKTMYVMEESITKVKGFLDGIAETGSYAGRETEGFVIRCRARDTKDSPWHDWFFKYKFEEPYLMYRQWRECTKAIISGKPPRFKKHQKITEEYLMFARRQLAKNPALGKLYNQNHGIIKMRDDFLRERGIKGSDIIRQELEDGEIVGNQQVTSNVVLVPIATIGCGKTTVALALVKLFGWGHIQNDNIQGKQRMLHFSQGICSLLAGHPVVIADKNNHQRRERRDLFDGVSKVNRDAHYVALHWVHDRSNLDQIRATMRGRVLNRGDNHQTIQAGSKSQSEIIGIMEGFLDRFEPCDTEKEPDSAFDHVIDLDVTSSSRENLETIVAQLNAEFPGLFGEMPTGEDLDKAIESAMNDYSPDIKHEIKGGSGKNKGKQGQMQQRSTASTGASTKKPPKLEYFSLRVAQPQIIRILDAVFRDQPPDVARVYRQLQKTRRIQNEFHVTLIHRASSSQEPAYWNELSSLHESLFQRELSKNENESDSSWPEPNLGACDVQLERVVFDNRVMCIVVRLINKPQDLTGPNGHANGSVGLRDEGFKTVNPIAHITIGTVDQSIKPKESNDLLKKWLQQGASAGGDIQEASIPGHVVLEGWVKGVLQKF